MDHRAYDGGNFLLDQLPAAELAAFRERLAVVELRSGDVLYPGGSEAELTYVYFPLRAVASMVAMLSGGSAVEAGTAGREGVVGVQCIFGSTFMFERWIAQVPGSAARIRLAEMRAIVESSTCLRTLLLRYLQSYLALLSQSIACNAHHPILERCARWLLLTQDRAGKSEFFLTQEFLAMMLGVRRPSVSIAAATLANAGLITYVRGSMRILDRSGLESASCECYRAVRREFERLLGDSFGYFDPQATASNGEDRAYSMRVVDDALTR